MKKLLIISAHLVAALLLIRQVSAAVSPSGSAMPHSDDFDDNSLDTGYWTVAEGDAGVTVEETGMEIKVSGTSTDTWWAKNGLRTPSFTKQGFQVAIDYKLVSMIGASQWANLRLYLEDGAHYFSVGYHDAAHEYVVAYRDAEGYHQMPNTVPAFGDEGTAFHRLRIVFNSSTNTASGYVDDVLVDALTSDFFTTPMYIQFHQESSVEGNLDVDCRFDNFGVAGYHRAYLPNVTAGHAAP